MKIKLSKKKLLIFIIPLILTTTIISYKYFSYQEELTATTLSTKKVEDTNLAIKEVPVEENKITYLQEKYQNDEVKAILSIDNDTFSYPVAQTTNNDYYLTHDYSKNYYALGSIYADYRVNLDDSSKILIFGHSSTIRDTAFNHLENYYDEEYFNTHRYLTLETKEGKYHYEIFSIYVETSDFTYMNINFNTDDAWLNHIKKLQNNSWYNTSIELSREDKVLILQTCSNSSKYKNYAKKYLLVIAKRIEK